MNVSIQDSYNLGWKLALVIKGFAHHSLLSTYEAERKIIASELISFDRRFSKMFSTSPREVSADDHSISAQEFRDAFIAQKVFSSGFAVDYGSNILVAKGNQKRLIADEASSTERGLFLKSKQYLACETPVGMRFPSFKVVNQSDAQPWHLACWLKADGRFRIVLFAGDVSNVEQMQRVRGFCTTLSRSDSVIQRRLRDGQRVQSFIEILTIHSAPRHSVELADFPALLYPFDEFLGWDYDKIFVDDESYYEGHGNAYEGYGVDNKRGCIVLVRPDQHVGWIGDLEDTNYLETYFEQFVTSS